MSVRVYRRSKEKLKLDNGSLSLTKYISTIRLIGALSAVIMASKNPAIQVSAVDRNEALISAWNSATPPIFEPGLEGLLYGADKRVFSTCTESSRVEKLTNYRSSGLW